MDRVSRPTVMRSQIKVDVVFCEERSESLVVCLFFGNRSLLIGNRSRHLLVFPGQSGQLDYTCGISDEEMTRRFKEAIRIDEEMRDIQGIP